MIPQTPTIAPILPILPIHRMARLSGMGAMRLMGRPQPTATLDAESTEVLGKISSLLKGNIHND